MRPFVRNLWKTATALAAGYEIHAHGDAILDGLGDLASGAAEEIVHASKSLSGPGLVPDGPQEATTVHLGEIAPEVELSEIEPEL